MIQRMLLRTLTLLWLPWAVFDFSAWGENQAPSKTTSLPPVSFRREIAPIFIKKCLICHNPDKAKGDFRMHSFAALTNRGSGKSPPILPGQPSQSKLYQLITTLDEEDRMPQKDQPLPDPLIRLIERWIQEGAVFDGPSSETPLASLLPRPVYPAPPAAYSRPVPILALAFSPVRPELAASGYHEVTIWDARTGQFIRRINNLPQRIQDLEFSPEGKWLAVAGGSPGQAGEMVLLDPLSGSIATIFGTCPDSVLVVKFSPDGSHLAFAGADNTIHFHELESGKELWRIEQHADWVMHLAFNPDGSRLASASRDKTARVLNTKTGELESTYVGHQAPVLSVAFHPQGHQVCTIGRDNKIHIWEVSEARKVAEISGFEDDLLRLLVRGDRIYISGADPILYEYSWEKRNRLQPFRGHRDWVYALAWDEQSQQLASGAFDGEVCVWNPDSGALVRRFFAAPGFRGPE